MEYKVSAPKRGISPPPPLPGPNFKTGIPLSERTLAASIEVMDPLRILFFLDEDPRSFSFLKYRHLIPRFVERLQIETELVPYTCRYSPGCPGFYLPSTPELPYTNLFADKIISSGLSSGVDRYCFFCRRPRSPPEPNLLEEAPLVPGMLVEWPNLSLPSMIIKENENNLFVLDGIKGYSSRSAIVPVLRDKATRMLMVEHLLEKMKIEDLKFISFMELCDHLQRLFTAYTHYRRKMLHRGDWPHTCEPQQGDRRHV